MRPGAKVALGTTCLTLGGGLSNKWMTESAKDDFPDLLPHPPFLLLWPPPPIFNNLSVSLLHLTEGRRVSYKRALPKTL